MTPDPQKALVRHVVAYERFVMPDIHFTIEDLMAEEEDVMVYLTIRGTHVGAYRGIAPRGRRVAIQAAQSMRVRDERLAAVNWHIFDRYTLI